MLKVAFHNLGCKVNAYETERMIQDFTDAGYDIVGFEDKADIYIVNTCTVTNIADRKSRQMLHRARGMNPAALVVACGCYVETGRSREAGDNSAAGRSREGGDNSAEGRSKEAGSRPIAKGAEQSAVTEGLLQTVGSGIALPGGTESGNGIHGVDLLVGNRGKKDIVKLVEEFIRDHAGRFAKPEDPKSEGFRKPEDPKSEGFRKPEKLFIRTKTGTCEMAAGETGGAEREAEPSENKSEDPLKSNGLRELFEHTRAYVKIQDGCEQFCSYCIIPAARGKVKSRRPEEIRQEIGMLAENGIKEVVLTGIHLSSYGIDLSSGEGAHYNQRAAKGEYVNRELMEVIRQTAGIGRIERIRLGSLEPRVITEELLCVIRENPKVCPHFHLSLQSGCDEVLKRMNRHYDTEEYERRVELIRSFFPHPAITTDVIVGFPGESEEEFLETRDFLNRIDFYETHIFKYSRRKGTVADRMEGQLTEKEKADRAGVLSREDAKRRKRFLSYYFNKEEEVLFEEEKIIEGERYFTGFNREYVKMALRSDEDLTNRIIRGRAGDSLLSEQLLVFYR